MKNMSPLNTINSVVYKTGTNVDVALTIIFYRYITENNKFLLKNIVPTKIDNLNDLKIGINNIILYHEELAEIFNSDVFNGVNSEVQILLFNEIYRIDLSEYKSVGNTLIDQLIESIIDNRSMQDVYTTPRSIGQIISQIVSTRFENKNQLQVYNPCVGLASFIVELNKILPQDTYYFAEDLNEKAIRWAKMRLIVNNILSFDLRVADVLENSNFSEGTDSQKYDIVVTNPPFGLRRWKGYSDVSSYDRWSKYPLRMDKHSGESAFLIQALDSLKEDGIATVIVPNSFLYNGRDKEVREFLINNGLIESIIHLPSGLFNRAMINTTIIVLSKKYNRNVLFIDASKEFLKNKYQNIIPEESIQKIVETWKSNEIIDGFSNLVQKNDLLDGDVVLDFKRYDVQNHIDLSDKHLINYSEVVRVCNRVMDVPNELKLVRIKNLSDDPFNYSINLENLESEINNKRRYQKITSKVLLVARRFNKLKPTLVEATEENPVYISNDIHAFEIINDTISVDYLVLQLYSDLVTAQLESKSMGSTIPTITVADLLNLKIELVRLEVQEQQLFYQASKLQADKDKIKEANLQDTIENLINQRTNELKWQLHNLRNGELLSIKNKASVLKKIITQFPEVSGLMIDEKRNLTLQDLINDLYVNSRDLAKKLSTIYEEQENYGDKTEFSILNFIKQFLNKQKYVDKSIVSFDQIFEDLKRNHIINFNENDLENIFSNVFENILRHGFQGEPTADDKIYIKYQFEDDFIVVSIFNTGVYIPINSEDYFADGGKQGTTGNSGKGGYIIKQCMERNEGIVSIESYDDHELNNYVFKIDLKFKVNK